MNLSYSCMGHSIRNWQFVFPVSLDVRTPFGIVRINGCSRIYTKRLRN